MLIGGWAFMGLVAGIALAGRSKLLVQLFCGLCLVFIVMLVIVKLTLSRQAAQQFLVGFLVALELSSAIGTWLAFIAARRRGLIGWPTIYMALSLTAALCALAMGGDAMHASQHPPVYAAIIATVSLAVAPLATAPLALAWNRTR